VIATFGDLQVGVVPRGQLDSCGGTRSEKGSCGFGRCSCTAVITSWSACGPVTGGLSGGLPHDVALGAETAGDDDAAVFLERLADRVSDSRTADSMNPQVLTTTRSARRTKARSRSPRRASA